MSLSFILAIIVLGACLVLVFVCPEVFFKEGNRPADWIRNARSRARSRAQKKKQDAHMRKMKEWDYLTRSCAGCGYQGRFDSILDSRSVEVKKSSNLLLILGLLLFAIPTLGLTLIIALFIPFSRSREQAKRAQQCPECGNIRPFNY